MERLKVRLISCLYKAMKLKFAAIEKQYLCVIAWFSPFLRG